MYGLKIVTLDDFKLGSMAFFKLGVDFGLKIGARSRSSCDDRR
jgi:hypothetical protein